MDLELWYLLGISLFLIYAGFIMLCPHKLSKELKKTISEVGIMHFTTETAAQKIIEESVVKKSKVFLFAYFFQNGVVSEDAILHSGLKNKKVCIEILNLTDMQLNHLRIRFYDMAVMNFGDFKFSEENQVSIKKKPEITPLRIALRPHLWLGYALSIVGAITFFTIFFFL